MSDPNNAHHTYNTGYAYTQNAMSSYSQAGKRVILIMPTTHTTQDMHIHKMPCHLIVRLEVLFLLHYHLYSFEDSSNIQPNLWLP